MPQNAYENRFDEQPMSCPDCGGVLVRDTPGSIVLHCTGCGRSWKMKPRQGNNPYGQQQRAPRQSNPGYADYRDEAETSAVYDDRTGSFNARPDYADGIQDYHQPAKPKKKSHFGSKLLMALAFIVSAGAIWLSFQPGYNIATPVAAVAAVILAIIAIVVVKKSGAGRLFVSVISIILSLGSVLLSLGVNAAIMSSRYGGLVEGGKVAVEMVGQVATGEKTLEQAALELVPFDVPDEPNIARIGTGDDTEPVQD